MGLAGTVVAIYRALASLPPPPPMLDGLATFSAVSALRLYRASISSIIGRQCMFQPSCSARALALFSEVGWSAGRIPVLEQLNRCNGAHVMTTEGGRCVMHTSDGRVFGEEEIAEHLVQNYRRTLASARFDPS